MIILKKHSFSCDRYWTDRKTHTYNTASYTQFRNYHVNQTCSGQSQKPFPVHFLPIQQKP